LLVATRRYTIGGRRYQNLHPEGMRGLDIFFADAAHRIRRLALVTTARRPENWNKLEM
jgi:hypothetical protein